MKSSQVMPKRSSTQVLQKHSPELKIAMTRKVIEEGKTQSSLAQETGISITNIYKWTRARPRWRAYWVCCTAF
jgi:transposase-like protein